MRIPRGARFLSAAASILALLAACDDSEQDLRGAEEEVFPICHATPPDGDPPNKWELITPANAGQMNGHRQHSADIIPAPDGGCPAPPEPLQPTDAPPPTEPLQPTDTPAPSTTEAPPFSTQPTPTTGEGPATTGEGPATTGEGPATTGEGPATSGEGPATTDEGGDPTLGPATDSTSTPTSLGSLTSEPSGATTTSTAGPTTTRRSGPTTSRPRPRPSTTEAAGTPPAGGSTPLSRPTTSVRSDLSTPGAESTLVGQAVTTATGPLGSAAGVPPSPAPPSSTTTPGGTIPVTGRDTSGLVLIASLFLVVGALAIVLVRRPPKGHTE